MLVGGLEHEFYDFPYIGNFIIPTDELIFFRGLKPPSSTYGFLWIKEKESKASELFVTFDVSGGLYESLAAVFLGFFCPYEVTQYNSMVQPFFCGSRWRFFDSEAWTFL